MQLRKNAADQINLKKWAVIVSLIRQGGHRFGHRAVWSTAWCSSMSELVISETIKDALWLLGNCARLLTGLKIDQTGVSSRKE